MRFFAKGEVLKNVTIWSLHKGPGEIWRPDIQIYNNADEANIKHYGMTQCIVKSDGEVNWVPPGHFKSFCTMDVTNWPYDTQECRLIFGSWTSHGSQINLTLGTRKVMLKFNLQGVGV